jgi:sugar (pentulose or hexulose) kinase
MTHTLIFDIGKTNKKCFLFDEDYQEVWKDYVRFDEIKDEDGHLCDNIAEIENWMITTFQKVISLDQFNIKAVNFSTYGASFVHVNKKGKPVAPLYNYLKPFPKDILNQFYDKYGSEMSLAKETASPPLQMLNSGLQLYYLKYAKPEIFKKIRWSLHLPQYLSFIFNRKPVSEFTSIGCHTMLWDYSKNDYHRWVYKEGIDKILPPIVQDVNSLDYSFKGKKLKMGFGIHDSSASLIPYLKTQKKPFLLISTGTWSISINPFNKDKLRKADLRNDCLNFLRPSGESVKAARLFLGNEYKVQVEILRSHYVKEEGYHRSIKFDEQLFLKLKNSSKKYFRLESIDKNSNELSKTNLSKFATYEEAYHQLMIELMELQIETINLAIGKSSIEKIFIDGGFADNDSFVKIIAHHFNKYKIRTTQSPLGSALGAAIIVSNRKVKKNFLKKHYAMKKQVKWK